MEHSDKNTKCCNLAPPETLRHAEAGEEETILKISGADCSDEVRAIKAALAKIGISTVSVNLVAATVSVIHKKDFEISNIQKAIESTGVRVVERDNIGFAEANRRRIALVGISGLLLALGLALDWFGSVPHSVLLGIFTVSTLLSGLLVFPKALRALLQRILDMNVLMSVAAIGAFAIGEYSEGATVVFLFSLAELLEAFSVARARAAIKEVLKLTPQVAQVRVGDAILTKPVLELKVDDVLIVRPGESIPLDGLVKEGNSAVNQAPLTGESVPVDKKPGDPVFAGTINEGGVLVVSVTKVFQDTKIARVIQMIEQAQEQKAPSERFVDRFAKIYTPVVFVIAISIALLPPLLFGQEFSVWFYRSLVLLVIACPCALVLATPISVVSGLASLARRGVLVKGGLYLEALGKIRAIALDKTGTLTEGKFKVQNYRSFGEKENEHESVVISQSLEMLSTHPLAKAMIEYGNAKGVRAKKVDRYAIVPGRGAEGWIEGHLFFVGNHRLTHDLGVCSPEIESYLTELEQKSLSVVIVGHKPHDGHDGEVLGVFGLGDTLKVNAREAIAALHAVGVEKVVVLSGDNQKTVDAICKLTGIDEGKGDLLPENKVSEVQNLVKQFTNVAMVGDGVNDAPALANATIGISMGAAGTDTAIETSDVSLMQDDLGQLSKAIAQGRRVLNIIRFNIGFAIVTKAVFLILAVMGISNLWLAVAADMGASLIVTANALRLIRSN